MGKVSDVTVSYRGQMSLPAAARRRWGLVGGGWIGAIDLGDAVLLVPGGVAAARRTARTYAVAALTALPAAETEGIDCRLVAP